MREEVNLYLTAPGCAAVLDSWRDLAETRSDVKHPMSPMALSMAALLCQLFLLFIVFSKKNENKSTSLFSLCLLLPLLCRDMGGGAGRTCFLHDSDYLTFLFPARIFLLV